MSNKYDSKFLNDSKLSFSNITMSGLKIDQLNKAQNSSKLYREQDLTKNSISFMNEDKNSIYSNHNLQDKNNVFFNKPNQIFKNKPENDINISTIENLNSSISSSKYNFDLQKSAQDKTYDQIRAELNEKKKANMKILNDIHSKTKRSFRGDFVDEYPPFNYVKFLGNKGKLKKINENFTEDDYNYNAKEEQDNDFSLMDEKQKKIAEIYRAKDLMNRNDIDMINGDKISNFNKNYDSGIFDNKRIKIDEAHFNCMRLSLFIILIKLISLFILIFILLEFTGF